MREVLKKDVLQSMYLWLKVSLFGTGFKSDQ